MKVDVYIYDKTKRKTANSAFKNGNSKYISGYMDCLNNPDEIINFFTSNGDFYDVLFPIRQIQDLIEDKSKIRIFIVYNETVIVEQNNDSTAEWIVHSNRFPRS